MTNIGVSKETKILCICQYGNVRSVGTKRRLTRRGYRNVIATGAENCGSETLMVLVDWADVVLVAEPHLADLLPPSGKVDVRFTIGPDVFGNSASRALQDVVKEQLNGIGMR